MPPSADAASERTRRARRVLGAALLVATLACRREDPRIRDLTRQAEQAETAAQALRQTWADQQRRFFRAGLGTRAPDAATLVLTSEQKRFLENLVNRERDLSRRGLVREILAQDARIATLQSEANRLREGLPAPDLVGVHESHYGLALRFLRGRGLDDADARRLLARTPLLDKLAPGFEVFHFYSEGAYSTWVGQGTAALSPRELNGVEREQLREARAEAQDQTRRAHTELAELARQKRAVEAEIEAVRSEYGQLLAGHAALGAETGTQAIRLNALHYHVGLRADLEAAGIIEVPLFGPPLAGRSWRDDIFRNHLDLRTDRRLVLQASHHGLERLGRVLVVPGSLIEGEHYHLFFPPDRRTATLEVLTPERFRNAKVVLALSP